MSLRRTGLRVTQPQDRLSPQFPSAAACPGVSCLSQLLGCISSDPMIPTPLLWSLSSSIIVTLGAHNIKQQERTQQVIRVRRVIRHPDYNPNNFSNDIMLLQARKTPLWPCPPGIRLPSQDLLPFRPSHPGCLTSPCGSGERRDTSTSLPCPGLGTTG